MTTKEWTVDDLIRLARDKSQQARSNLAVAIVDLSQGTHQVLTENDRAIMFDILRRIIWEVESTVRRRLAQIYADQSEVPRDLILMLANDGINVAFPILVKSELLKDEELIEIIQQCAMEHRVAIAMRPVVSEPVSDALVEAGDEEVIETLLSNDGARISEKTLDGLVETSSKVVRFRRPLASRRDLPLHLARKLAYFVSAALRQHLAARGLIDPNEFDDVAEAAVNGTALMDQESDLAAASEAHSESARPTNAAALMELLSDSNMYKFLAEFVTFTGLRAVLLRRFLFEPGGEGLAITCKATGLSKHEFGSIFMQFRQGRLGEDPVAPNELRDVMKFFDRIGVPESRAVLRRWRREADYQDAIRMVDDALAKA